MVQTLNRIQPGSIRSNVVAIGANVGGPVRSRAESMRALESGGSVTALKVAGLAAGALGAVGLVGSGWLGRKKNEIIKDRKMNALANDYRNEVGLVLGMDPSKVTVKHLELAAQRDPNNQHIGALVRQVKQQYKDNNRSELLSTTGALTVGAAAGGLGLLPGGSLLAHGAAKMAFDGAGAVAGGAMSSAFDKNMLHADEVMQRIDHKSLHNQKVTAGDVALLRIALNAEWQAEYKKKQGHAFHSLTPDQQLAAATSAATVNELKKAQEVANKVNIGVTPPSQLLLAAQAVNDDPMGSNDNESVWQQKMAARNQQRGSFTQREAVREAQRAAASTGQEF